MMGVDLGRQRSLPRRAASEMPPSWAAGVVEPKSRLPRTSEAGSLVVTEARSYAPRQVRDSSAPAGLVSLVVIDELEERYKELCHR